MGINRRNLLKKMGFGVSIPFIGEISKASIDCKWHKGKIEKLIIEKFEIGKHYIYSDRSGNFLDEPYIREFAYSKHKDYQFVLTNNNGEGIVRFNSDAIAHNKVVRHGFNINERFKKTKGEIIKVEYMIDNDYVIHLR